MSQFRADRVAIYFVARRSGEELQPIVQCGRPLPDAIESIWQTHERALARTTIESENGCLYDGEWLRNHQLGSPIASAAAMPIRVNGRVLGAICLTRRGTKDVFEELRHLIDFAAETLSQTLRRVFDEATIRRQARHDHLTDLVNRRSFDAYLATEVERVRCGDSPNCSLILADLDRFKSYNDRYGHQAGDHILREAARVLADQVSRLRMGERCIVARYGGEEFAILLPNVGQPGALRIAEGIRAAMECAPIKIQNSDVQVTISLGVANYPHHGNVCGIACCRGGQVALCGKKPMAAIEFANQRSWCPIEPGRRPIDPIDRFRDAQSEQTRSECSSEPCYVFVL